MHALTNLRAKLRERYYDASPENRIRIKSDIEELERESLRLSVFQRAFDHLPKEASAARPSQSAEDPPIAPMWLDRFNAYARMQNESWRQDLLARALAREADQPGSVGPRALWFIGTMDENSFHAFAALIDISTAMSRGRVVPNWSQYVSRVVPNCVLDPNIKVGNIMFLLSELGIIGIPSNTSWEMTTDELLTAKYAGSSFVLRALRDVQFPSIVFTPLGNTVASLYDQHPNELGKEIFNMWILGINRQIVEVSEVVQTSLQMRGATPAAK